MLSMVPWSDGGFPNPLRRMVFEWESKPSLNTRFVVPRDPVVSATSVIGATDHDVFVSLAATVVVVVGKFESGEDGGGGGCNRLEMSSRSEDKAAS